MAGHRTPTGTHPRTVSTTCRCASAAMRIVGSAGRLTANGARSTASASANHPMHGGHLDLGLTALGEVNTSIGSLLFHVVIQRRVSEFLLSLGGLPHVNDVSAAVLFEVRVNDRAVGRALSRRISRSYVAARTRWSHGRRATSCWLSGWSRSRRRHRKPCCGSRRDGRRR